MKNLLSFEEFLNEGNSYPNLDPKLRSLYESEFPISVKDFIKLMESNSAIFKDDLKNYTTNLKEICKVIGGTEDEIQVVPYMVNELGESIDKSHSFHSNIKTYKMKGKSIMLIEFADKIFKFGEFVEYRGMNVYGHFLMKEDILKKIK